MGGDCYYLSFYRNAKHTRRLLCYAHHAEDMDLCINATIVVIPDVTKVHAQEATIEKAVLRETEIVNLAKNLNTEKYEELQTGVYCWKLLMTKLPICSGTTEVARMRKVNLGLILIATSLLAGCASGNLTSFVTVLNELVSNSLLYVILIFFFLHVVKPFVDGYRERKLIELNHRNKMEEEHQKRPQNSKGENNDDSNESVETTTNELATRSLRE